MRPRSLDECDSGGGHSRVDDVILGELAIRGGELFLNETDDSMFTRLDFCECAGEWRSRRFHAFHRNRRLWRLGMVDSETRRVSHLPFALAGVSRAV